MDAAAATHARLVRRGRALEGVTLGWNAVGVVVLGIAAVTARSVALAGFGLDSLVEIGASTVVLWELADVGESRRHRALRVIGWSFVVASTYILVQAVVVLVGGYHPHRSPLGIGWTAVTAAVMFTLAAGKARTGRALDNPVLLTEGRATLIDGLLAGAVLLGLSLNAAFGAWWADPAAGLVIVYYGLMQGRDILVDPWRRVMGLVRTLAALARDPRIPRPVRWLLLIGLLPIPGPFDEALALVALGMIAVFWRPVLRQLLHEHRPTPASAHVNSRHR